MSPTAPHAVRRRWRRALLGVAAVLGVVLSVVLFGRWRAASLRGGQLPAEPFRIAGNLYYVGANDVSAFLITGPAGHVLIDGGYPGTPPLILASIAKLGFRIRDVKVLLNSEPHYDHAGGLAELQRASGAALWASDASADVLAAGGDDPANHVLIRALTWVGIVRYPAARVQHRVKDGDTVRVGPVALVAHLTPGHTRGCTSWAFPVRDEGPKSNRTLEAVSACSLEVAEGARYPGDRVDLARSVRVLRGLPADIWVTSHARLWGRYRKFAARGTATDSAAPFIDPAGYRAYLDSGAARLRRAPAP